MKVSIENTGFDYFGLFLGIALIFLFVCFVWQGYKKYKIPVHVLSIVYLSMVLFMFIGAKLFTISSGQWLAFFETGSFPITNRLTILGAIAFGPLGILVGKKLLRIKVPFLDMIAIPTLIAMAIQRLGCLFAGCCHGIMTNSSFGVCYGPYTTAHLNNYKKGIIENVQDLTPPLHPVQLYFLLICMVSSFLLFRFKNKFHAPGSLFMMAISFFVFGRFFAEFLRDPLTNGEFGQSFLGLKLLQYLLLISSCCIWIIVAYRERKTKSFTASFNSSNSPFVLSSIALVVLSLTTYLIFNWFTPMEKGCLFLFICLSVLFSVVFFFEFFLPFTRMQTAFSFALALLIWVFPCTAQIAFNNSADSCYTYKEFSVGGSFHSFSHYHESASNVFSPRVTPNCNGGYDTSYVQTYAYPRIYTHSVYTGGVSFAQYYNMGRYNRLFYKAAGYLGLDTDDDPKHRDNPIPENKINQFGAALIVGADHKIVGLEAGVVVGNFRTGDVHTGEKNTVLTSGKPEILAYPIIRFRMGMTKICFFDGRAGYPFIGLNGSRYPITVGIGTGFGRDNGTILRMGIGAAGKEFLFSTTLKVVALKNWGIELTGGFSSSPHFNGSISHFFGTKKQKKLKYLLKPSDN